jgi:hypothetical protein
MNPEDDLYVEKLLGFYLSLPQTPSRASRHDRELARQLRRQQMPLETVEMALLLATARRSFRDPSLPPLQPIRSLHYFLPVIDEIRDQRVGLDYLRYLRQKLAPFLTQNSPSK